MKLVKKWLSVASAGNVTELLKLHRYAEEQREIDRNVKFVTDTDGRMRLWAEVDYPADEESKTTNA